MASALCTITKTYHLVSAKVRVGLSSCRLQGPKSIHSGNGLPLIALCHLVSLPASMLQTAPGQGFPVSGGI